MKTEHCDEGIFLKLMPDVRDLVTNFKKVTPSLLVANMTTKRLINIKRPFLLFFFFLVFWEFFLVGWFFGFFFLLWRQFTATLVTAFTQYNYAWKHRKHLPPCTPSPALCSSKIENINILVILNTCHLFISNS